MIAKVRRLLGKNYTDDEICDQLNIKSTTLLSAKSEILTFDTTLFEHLDSSGVFSQYLLNQKQNIIDLDRLINSTNPKKANEKTAFVAAIKLRADILSQINKLGQELGLIDKVAKEVNVKQTGKIDVSLTMTNINLKKEIEAEKQKLHKLAAGNQIEMREELLGVTDDDLRNFLPASVKEVAPAKKRKSRLIKR